jgi:hypothetical protein
MTSQKTNETQPGDRSDTTLKEGYISFDHPSIMLKLTSGEFVEVDEGVVDLVKLMNSIPGIETKGSCQGHEPNYGYVQFMPDGSEENVHASIYFMYHMMKHMHGVWVMHRHRMAEYEASTGTEHHDAYRFKFTAELGNGYVLKWSPFTYSAVLAAARKAAKETMGDA